jgi:signal transduction histidine kinase
MDITDIIASVEAGTSLDVQHEGVTNITADKLMLSRLLLNLGRNAQQAGASRLSIDIWTAGHLLVMDILDNGPGLSDAQRAALFTPFSSSNPARTGLGLSICLDLAVAMGGALKLSRSSPEGGEFRLQLPLQITQ